MEENKNYIFLSSGILELEILWNKGRGKKKKNFTFLSSGNYGITELEFCVLYNHKLLIPYILDIIKSITLLIPYLLDINIFIHI